MIPAVIYARFSSHSQTEQSIEGQLAACYDFAEREGYTVIGEYIDRAISARTDDRPDFQRMIADSAKHTFEVILVYQLDRFSRNRYDSAVNKQKLKKNGVRVVSARENITADASGVLMEAVLEGMAEYYSAELAQKIRRGMDISGSKCLATGGRPALGYKVDETKHYQIDEDTAPTVVKIFEMYASGMTVAQIITELNHQNIKTSTGADFNKNSLRKMLTNKRYIGIYTYKGSETPGGIPRIVSDELFNRVAEMMEKNKKAPARARAKEEYLLTTKLFCGHCREMMTGISGTSKTGTIHNYYTCNGRKKKLCSKKNVQKEYIEDRVIALARAQLTDENISKISKAVAALCEREKESSEYRRLERQRRDIEKQKANLVDALKYGKATETLLNEIAKLESSIEGIDRQILMEKVKCLDLKEPEIAFFLTKLRDGDINDITYRRAIIAVMVNAVYLYDDGRLTVIFNSSDRPVEVTEGLLADVEEDAAEFVSGVCRSTGEELPRFDCGESGSTLRFLIPIALAVAGGGIFTGRGRLMERPQKPYFDLFEEKGIFHEQADGVLTVRGKLEPGEYRLPGNVSSQFFTGLLFALPLLDGPSTIVPTTEVESWDYILMTMDALMGAGVTVTEPRKDRNCFPVTPFAYTSFDRIVEADWSQAGFWYGARVLGNPVEVTGLNEYSAQGDRAVKEYSKQLAQPGDVDIDVSQCPDLVPPLAVMAAVRQGTTRLQNAARLRIKESDRLASVTATLNALGARVEEHSDSLTIHGLDRLEGGAAIDCCNDHRIAMMAAVAATRCQKPVTLLGAHCVKKSYPNFWEHYRMLGGDLDVLISG